MLADGASRAAVEARLPASVLQRGRELAEGEPELAAGVSLSDGHLAAGDVDAVDDAGQLHRAALPERR